MQNVPLESWNNQRFLLQAAFKRINQIYGTGAYEKVLKDTLNDKKAGFNYKTLNNIYKQAVVNADSALRFRQLLQNMITRYGISFDSLFLGAVEQQGNQDNIKLDEIVKKCNRKLEELVFIVNPPQKIQESVTISPTDAFKGTYIIIGANTDGLISIQPVLIGDNGQVDIKTRENTPYRGEVDYDGSECLSLYFRNHMTVPNQFYYSHYLFSTCRISQFTWAYGVSSKLSKFGFPKASIELLVPVKKSFAEMKFEEIFSDNGTINNYLLIAGGLDGIKLENSGIINNIKADLDKAVNYLQTPPLKVMREPFVLLGQVMKDIALAINPLPTA